MAKYVKRTKHGFTRFMAVSEHEDTSAPRKGEYSIASVTLEHSRATPNFVWDPTTRKHADVSVGSEPASTLFTVTPPTITGAFSHPAMRHTVPSLLAMSVNAGGPETQADYSLSEYSSRLAKKGIRQGLIKGHEENPEANKTNMVGSMEPFRADRSTLREYSPITEEELQLGKQTVRNFLRPPSPRKRTPRSQHPQQLSLFQFGDQ